MNETQCLLIFFSLFIIFQQEMEGDLKMLVRKRKKKKEKKKNDSFA